MRDASLEHGVHGLVAARVAGNDNENENEMMMMMHALDGPFHRARTSHRKRVSVLSALGPSSCVDDDVPMLAGCEYGFIFDICVIPEAQTAAAAAAAAAADYC